MTRAFARWTLLVGVLAGRLRAAASSEPCRPRLDCTDVSPDDRSPSGEFTILDPPEAACVRLPAAGRGGGGVPLRRPVRRRDRERTPAPRRRTSSRAATGPTAAVGAGPGWQASLTAPTAAARVPRPAAGAGAGPVAAAGRGRARRAARISASVAAVPPVVGAKRTFEVCATTTCDSFVQSTATAKVVGQRVAIYLDDAAPAGYTQTDLDEVGALFDTHLYPIDTTAFGRESDLDNERRGHRAADPARERAVARLQHTGSVILGFFFGLDLLPSQAALERRRGVLRRWCPTPDMPGCTVAKDVRDRVAARRVHPRVPAHDQLQPARAGARRRRPRIPGSTRGCPTSPRSWAAASVPDALCSRPSTTARPSSSATTPQRLRLPERSGGQLPDRPGELHRHPRGARARPGCSCAGWRDHFAATPAARRPSSPGSWCRPTAPAPPTSRP